MTLGHPTTRAISTDRRAVAERRDRLAARSVDQSRSAVRRAGPSRYGTWAVSEMEVSVQLPGKDECNG